MKNWSVVFVHSVLKSVNCKAPKLTLIWVKVVMTSREGYCDVTGWVDLVNSSLLRLRNVSNQIIQFYWLAVSSANIQNLKALENSKTILNYYCFFKKYSKAFENYRINLPKKLNKSFVIVIIMSKLWFGVFLFADWLIFYYQKM